MIGDENKFYTVIYIFSQQIYFSLSSKIDLDIKTFTLYSLSKIIPTRKSTNLTNSQIQFHISIDAILFKKYSSFIPQIETNQFRIIYRGKRRKTSIFHDFSGWICLGVKKLTIAPRYNQRKKNGGGVQVRLRFHSASEMKRQCIFN